MFNLYNTFWIDTFLTNSSKNKLAKIIKEILYSCGKLHLPQENMMIISIGDKMDESNHMQIKI